jgi:hypothetical protein
MSNDLEEEDDDDDDVEVSLFLMFIHCRPTVHMVH